MACPGCTEGVRAMRPPSRSPALLLSVLLVVLQCATGLVYLIIEPDAEEQCFLVEQPQSTIVVVSYDIPAYSSSKFTISASIGSGPSAHVMQTQTVESATGVFKFAAARDGLHTVCIDNEGLKKSTKIGIDISYGQADAYYEELAREAHIDVLEATIMKLTAQMSQILNEADYMKDREVVFHQQCERMNAAAKWWPMLQVAILLITGVFQVRHLKRFFKSKRLV